jgi:hypothetical protein
MNYASQSHLAIPRDCPLPGPEVDRRVDVRVISILEQSSIPDQSKVIPTIRPH